MKFDIKEINTDILIIGGGTAGCQAGIRVKELEPMLDVVILEKANIKRSGCLAAGVNAINAYLTSGETPQTYVDYLKKENSGLIREDLAYTIGERLNQMTRKLEKYGLSLLKDENDEYVARAKRSIRINGENIKPILAEAVEKSGVKIFNKTIVTNLIKREDRVIGAYAFSLEKNEFYVVNAKAVICSAGGAAGIYRSNNPGAARNKMWYPPFNAGSGFAMGLRAGAEMTNFEMRFIALRTKDTISPTGTVAQGIKAVQVNAQNEEYMGRYPKRTTDYRLYATVQENQKGNGPCYLNTKGINENQVLELKKAYLNMSPSIVLKWADDNTDPSRSSIEIVGSEPYIVGGHGQAGYWVDTDRRSTVKGLYAAGDIAGGSPKKYVTGAMAEGEIAAEDAVKYVKTVKEEHALLDEIKKEYERVFKPFEKSEDRNLKTHYVLDLLQKIMDKYAGGISQNYVYSEAKLLIAKEKLDITEEFLNKITVKSSYELMLYHELVDKFLVAKTLIEHMLFRKETRWKCYQERVDYPEIDNENWRVFVNSKYDEKTNEIRVFKKEAPKEFPKEQ